LEPGQLFGEGCHNGHPLRIATTTAMEECVITSITKEAMIATLHTEPKFSELFMAYLLTRNSRVEEDLIDQLFNSSEKRLARLLLLLAHFGRESTPQPILVDISQETLAEMIGKDPIPGELLHEQIPQTWTHQLQWKDRSSQFAVERRFA
jgi:CRP/FNR family cyclic AMP-dependent transcriptional regulator